MPYDSNLPVDHSPVVAAELRNQFNGLKALIDAQQTQISAQTTQIDTQATQISAQTAQLAAQQTQMNAQSAQLAVQTAQITALQAHFPLPAPDISSDLNASADGSIAKTAVVIAPEAWEFITSFSPTIDPNVDMSGCTSVGVLAGSDDGGSAWTKHCDGCSYGPFTACRYQSNGRWSLFSGWVQSKL